MRRIKDRAVSGLANPVERSHIGHEVVISERSAAFRETEFWIAEGDKLVGNISNIPWREKLAFFNIKCATRRRRRAEGQFADTEMLGFATYQSFLRQRRPLLANEHPL